MNGSSRSDAGYKRIAGSAANVRHGSFNDNVSNSGTSTTSLRSSQNASRASAEHTPTSSEIWAAPSKESTTAALQHRAAIYDSFITAKADLKSPQLGATNSDLAAQNVARSRSFYNMKASATPEQQQRTHSDDIVDLEDPDSTLSVTDVRVNIQREKSLRLLRGGVAPSPHLTSSRTPSGSISYIAWDDSFNGVTLPPLKTWTEEALLQFGHTAYHDENLSQITDYLYIGDIYAANNEHLLCRLNVDAIVKSTLIIIPTETAKKKVDLSNLRPEDLRKLKACHIPCTCPVNANHQRAKLIIGVKNSESEEIAAYFDEINRFIESIRRSGRKVLVHSVRGQGRSAVAIIQYLMQIHHLPMQSAFRVTKLSRTLKINPVFRETLEFLESQLRNEGKLPPVQPQRILAPRVVV